STASLRASVALTVSRSGLIMAYRVERYDPPCGGATAVPHKTRQAGMSHRQKKSRPDWRNATRVFRSVRNLFSDDHFLDEGLSIDFESIEVNARRDVVSRL